MLRYLTFLVLFFYSAPILQAQETGVDELHYPQLASAFYILIKEQNFWLDSTHYSLRKDFINVIDSAANWALDPNDYHDKELHQLADIPFTEKDSVVVPIK